jgi:hypothetical protein
MSIQSERWRHLADHLGIGVVAPFQLAIGGERATFAALLPQFGGSAGMIVDPEWESIEPHSDSLFETGYGYSAVTLDDTVTDEDAREMLRDWGWSGSATRPDWL